MHPALLVLHALVTLVFLAVDTIHRGVVGVALKGLVIGAQATPGFHGYLGDQAGVDQITAQQLPDLIRGIADERWAAFLLPKLAGLDVLEINERGRLHSLIKPNSPYNGVPPHEIRRVRGLLPILLLDRRVPVEAIDTAGPVILTRPPKAFVRSDSVIVLGGRATWSARDLEAPLLVKDRDVIIVDEPALANIANLNDVLAGARAPLLAALRGEPLLPEVAARPSAPPPVLSRGSRLGVAWTRMTCRFGWFAFDCRWRLDQTDLQTLVDRTLNEIPVTRVISLSRARLRMDVRQVRALIDGGRIGLTFDLTVGADLDQPVLGRLFEHPVKLRGVTAWIDEATYDRGTRRIFFSRPKITALGETDLGDPVTNELVRTAANVMLARAFGREPSYDIRQKIPFVGGLVRSIGVSGDHVHARFAFGRCARWLGSARPMTKAE